MSRQKLSKLTSVSWLVLFTMIAVMIANVWSKPIKDDPGNMSTILFPAFAGSAAIVLLLLIDWFLPRLRIFVTILLCAGLLVLGYALR
jgi:di/tricarboxylate transporter